MTHRTGREFITYARMFAYGLLGGALITITLTLLGGCYTIEGIGRDIAALSRGAQKEITNDESTPSVDRRLADSR